MRSSFSDYIKLLYCGYPEKKLGKLEGSNKRKLTSRDVISSLSEAHEDHMRQLMNDTGTSVQDPSAYLYDPWKPYNASAPTNTDGNTPKHFEDKDLEDGHLEIRQQSPSGWKYLCCSWCSTQTVAYSRASRRITSGDKPLTSLTPEEEHAFLLDCDELGLTWEKDGENR